MAVQTEQQAGEGEHATRVEWAPVPRVNLLPPEILAARSFRKVKARLALVVVVTFLVVAAGVVWAQGQVGSAQAALDVTTAQTAALHRQEARYAEVPEVTNALASAETARATALGQDLLWYRLLNDIALAAPANVWLTGVGVTLSGPGSPAGSAATSVAAANSGADALTPAGIGKVTVSGTAVAYPDVAAWLDSIVKVYGLDGSTLQTVTRVVAGTSPAQLQFTSQVVVSDKALSHRFDRKAG
jgi:Tfp pilus assembly protein PilN